MDWNAIKLILTKSIYLNILKISLKLKSNNESMMKTSTNYDYGNKAFLEIKVYFSHIPLKLHVLQWYNVLISSSSLKIFLHKKQSYVLFKFKWW
jgi:hypothetical protein